MRAARSRPLSGDGVITASRSHERRPWTPYVQYVAGLEKTATRLKRTRQPVPSVAQARNIPPSARVRRAPKASAILAAEQSSQALLRPTGEQGNHDPAVSTYEQGGEASAGLTL